MIARQERLKGTYPQQRLNPSGIISRVSCGTIKKRNNAKTLHHQARCGAELARYPGPRSRSVSPRNRTTAMSLPFLEYERPKRESRRRSSRQVEGRTVRFRRSLPLFVLLSYESGNRAKGRVGDRDGLESNGGAETNGAATSAMNRAGRTSATK